MAKCSVRRNWYRSLSTSLVLPWYLLGTSLVPPRYLRKVRKNPEKISSKFGKILEQLRKFWQKLEFFQCKNLTKTLRKEKRLEVLGSELLLLIFTFSRVVLARFFFPGFSISDSRTVQRSALCRSRRELSNAYLLAKIGVDTAENEPLEVWGKIQFTIHFTP